MAVKFRSRRTSLRTQLLLLIVLVFVVPSILIGIFSYHSLENKLAKSEKERIISSSDATFKLLVGLGNLLGVAKTNSYWEDHLIAVQNRDKT